MITKTLIIELLYDEKISAFCDMVPPIYFGSS